MLEAKDGKQEIKCLSCMELVFPFHLEIPCIYSMPFTESFLPRGVYCRSWHATAYSPNLAWQPFLCGSRAKNGFYICKSLVGGRESKEEKYFVTCENYITFKFHCSQITFHWNTAMPTCLYIIICGCFHPTVTEWVVVSEMVRSTASKIFTVRPFYPLFRGSSLPLLSGKLWCISVSNGAFSRPPELLVWVLQVLPQGS